MAKLPDELRRREGRLANIREAKQALEDDARAQAAAQAEQKVRDKGEDEGEAMEIG